MITDKQTELSKDQAVTASAGSQHYYDKGEGKGDFGLGEPQYLVFTCTEAAASGGASTVTFKLQMDDNTSFSSATDVAASPAIPKADLVVGYTYNMVIPPGVTERYIRAYYDVAVANLTAGKFTAQIVQNIQKNAPMPDAI